MVTDDSNARSPGGKPTIQSIEPATVTVQPDFDVGGVSLEIADQDGAGFKTLFDLNDALDATMKLIGAVHRLRRLGETS
jgi:hypothetical protein